VKTERFIHLRSPKFPILSGEEEEIGNPGMYGKALCAFLEEKLRDKGYDVPFSVAEDWGWWVEIRGEPFKLGVCVYCGPGHEGQPEYGVLVGLRSVKVWSWSKFKSIDTSATEERLFGDLMSIFSSDPEVEVIGVTPDCPVYAEDWPGAENG
jgi:hypothetical protein